MDGLRPSLDLRAPRADAVADGTGAGVIASPNEWLGGRAERSGLGAQSADVQEVPGDARRAHTTRAVDEAPADGRSGTRRRSLRMRNWLFERVVAMFALVAFFLSFLYRGDQ